MRGVEEALQVRLRDIGQSGRDVEQLAVAHPLFELVHQAEEMVEAIDHPFFVGTQAHPEFRSRPNRPHPLYTAFIKAALAK